MVLVLLFLSAASRRRFAIMLSRSHCCLDTRGSRLFCHPERARAFSSEGDGEPFFFVGCFGCHPEESRRTASGRRRTSPRRPRLLSVHRLTPPVFPFVILVCRLSRVCEQIPRLLARRGTGPECQEPMRPVCYGESFLPGRQASVLGCSSTRKNQIIELHAEQYNQLAWATRYKSHLVMRCHHPVTIC